MIKIPEDFLFTHTPTEIVIYSVAEFMFHKINCQPVYLTPEMIYGTIYGKAPNVNIKNEYSCAFKTLVADGIFTANWKMVSVNEDVYSGYIMLPFDYFKKVMQLNRGKYIYVYLLKLLTTRNYKQKVGYQKIEYLSELCEITPTTVSVYNKALEDAGILYIRHSKSCKFNHDGSIYKPNNVYGLIDERNVIDEYADKWRVKSKTHS